MKEIKAPESIYFTSSENGTHYYSEGVPLGRNSIKYVRADTFIEKACAWFRTLDDKEPPYTNTEEFIEGFKKAMKL